VRRLLPAALACTALLAAAAAPADAARHHKGVPCAARHSKTVESTRDVRVWGRADTNPDGNGGHVYYACLKRTGRQVRLFQSTGDDFSFGADITSVKVAGRYVAYVVVDDSGCSKYAQCPPSDPDGESATVVAFDVARRRAVGRLQLPVPPEAYVVTQRGGLAVLSNGKLVGVDSAGTRQLDAGTIDGRTLRAEISIVSWIRDGVERFARLR
jgi:hypothetical protein